VSTPACPGGLGSVLGGGAKVTGADGTTIITTAKYQSFPITSGARATGWRAVGTAASNSNVVSVYAICAP
jgi:hypothetical protein